MNSRQNVLWRKSSHSDHQGGNCVEVADLTPVTNRHDSHWRKSSHSGHSGGDCVEVADLTPVIGIRDSKNPDGPKLALGRDAWRALVLEIKADGHATS